MYIALPSKYHFDKYFSYEMNHLNLTKDFSTISTILLECCSLIVTITGFYEYKNLMENLSNSDSNAIVHGWLRQVLPRFNFMAKKPIKKFHFNLPCNRQRVVFFALYWWAFALYLSKCTHKIKSRILLQFPLRIHA